MRERLVSLDVLRGWTVALMILVNNPGSWAHVPAPLRHAPWHGLTPTDLVFPFFLFVMGGAMALSLDRRRAAGMTRQRLMRQIVRRAAIIFALGLLLNGFPFGLPLDLQSVRTFTPMKIAESLAGLRMPGVLQRIALCWLLAATTIVLLPRARSRALAAGLLLLMYEAAMRLPLVAGWGRGSFELQDNLARWIDLKIFDEAHLYHIAGQASDPEGLLPTLTATLTTLLGFAAVAWLARAPVSGSRLVRLAAAGGALLALGLLAQPWEPINKQLWTATYVLVTGGLATIALAVAVWLVDVRRWRRWTKPAEVYGLNPIAVFVGSGLLARVLAMSRWPHGDGGLVSLHTLAYRDLFAPWAGAEAGSVLYAVANVLFWLGVAWWMARRGITIRV